MPRALAACMERPFGAAYLTLSAREALKPAADDGAAQRPWSPTDSATVVAQDAREQAARALVGAAGEGQAAAGRDRARRSIRRTRRGSARWVSEWNLPVAVTPKVKGIVDETAANFVGVVGGMAADDVMCDAIAAADLLVGFGLDPVEIDKTWHAELPIHWMLEAPNVGGIVPPGAALVDHARAPRRAARRSGRRRRGRRRSASSSRSAATMLNDRSGAVGRDVAGRHRPGAGGGAAAGDDRHDRRRLAQIPLRPVLAEPRSPETFWMSNGLSGMAYGLSAAIGAKLARPDVAGARGGRRRRLLHERAGARDRRTRRRAVHHRRARRRQLLADQAVAGGKEAASRTGMDFGPIDTVKMAEACGVDGLRTTNPDELASAAARAVERRRSLVVAVPGGLRRLSPDVLMSVITTQRSLLHVSANSGPSI